MANEEILKAMYERGAAGMGTAMDLARADEREKMQGLYHSQSAVDAMIQSAKAEMLKSIISQIEQPQGVEVWVSWDNNNSMVAPEIWIMRPRPNMNGTFTGKVHHDAISSELNISPGQCKKFRIVRVGE